MISKLLNSTFVRGLKRHLKSDDMLKQAMLVAFGAIITMANVNLGGMSILFLAGLGAYRLYLKNGKD